MDCVLDNIARWIHGRAANLHGHFRKGRRYKGAAEHGKAHRRGKCRVTNCKHEDSPVNVMPPQCWRPSEPADLFLPVSLPQLRRRIEKSCSRRTRMSGAKAWKGSKAL